MSDRRALEDFIHQHQRLFVLTGQGSARIPDPDYRDTMATGSERRRSPTSPSSGPEANRQRYWARSLIGWQRFGRAQPNGAHHALANLEARGGCEILAGRRMSTGCIRWLVIAMSSICTGG